ncbi:MAG: DUF3108 domain-containing protein [Rhodocyclales bacterium]|nr:DUF3108 domain-containing protein [Rhodocyclales bacterium]
MPLLFAFVASLSVHAAVLLGPGWGLPLSQEPEPPTTLDAVIARPAPRVEAPPAKAPQKAAPARPRIAAESPAATPEARSLPQPEQAAATVPPPPPEPSPAAAPAAVEAAAPVPARTALPGRGRARFTVTRGEGGFVIGQAIYTWEHDGFRYRLKNLIETTGLAAVFRPVQSLASSEGEIGADGLRPGQFRQERVGGVDTASFDWLGRFVSYAGRRDPIVNGTQDLLSMYYQLMLLAPTDGAVEMPIATGRKLETYRFEVLGEVALATAGGERRTIHVRARGGGDTIEIWLPAGEGAIARGMPLKIRFIDRKGEIFDQIADDTDTGGKQ